MDTDPSKPAECKATNDKGSWQVKTPGAITVNKSGTPLSITCECPDGWGGEHNVPSTTSGAVYGNLFAGGIIGAAVDMSSGAAYEYPTTIVVPISSRQNAGQTPGPAIAQPAVVGPKAKLMPLQGTNEDLSRFTVKHKETAISPISSRLSDAVGFLNMTMPEGSNYDWTDSIMGCVKSGNGKGLYLTESHCVIMEFAEPKNELTIAVMKSQAAKKQ
ncbi:MAG: hypothetical protein HY910_02325 [Desulfarculus sp.]|nr:hypothetical protein [Desulfarculus sp.]